MAKLHLFGFEYDVIQASTMHEIGGHHGDVRNWLNTIRIAMDAHKEQRQSTIIHEVIHAIDYNLNLKVPEDIVCAIETGLFSFLKHNGCDMSFFDQWTEAPNVPSVKKGK